MAEFTLSSSDGEEFKVPKGTIEQSNVFKGATEDGDTEVPVPQATTAVLKKIIEYCDHVNGGAAAPDIPQPNPKSAVKLGDLVDKWYADFCFNQSQEEMINLITAAKNLDMPGLTALCGCYFAFEMRARDGAELKAYLGIVEEEKKEN